jgi:hypothetical protein
VLVCLYARASVFTSVCVCVYMCVCVCVCVYIRPVPNLVLRARVGVFARVEVIGKLAELLKLLLFFRCTKHHRPLIVVQERHTPAEVEASTHETHEVLSPGRCRDLVIRQSSGQADRWRSRKAERQRGRQADR